MTAAGGDGPVIDVRGLGKRFDDRWAVRGLDLAVRRGELFGVLGPNGAGKSTTIRLCCGLLEASEGSGTVLGLDIARDSEAIKARIGYMTQAFSLYTDLDVTENLRFYAGLHGLPFLGRSAAVERQIARYGLGPRRGQVVATLSGGWKQRVALACATIHDPDLLFLDEPTAGVDPVSRRDFWQEIHALAAGGTTVLVTTHYMDEAEHCHRLAFVFAGRLLESGTPAEVIARSGLAAASGTLGDPLAASRALRTRPDVVEAAVVGPRVRCVARGVDPIALLADAGATDAAGERTTVEDAFVALVRAAGSAA